MSWLSLFVTCPRGVEPLLAQELAALGASAVHDRTGGVAAQASLECAYRICLWSRTASRVLLPLRTFAALDAEALYAAARELPWSELFDPATSFAVEVAGRSPAIRHTHYAGLKVKDAIVDHFRARGYPRPNVDTVAPGLRIHLHLDREQATLSLDLSGDSLHRRGYRHDGAEAPLKENLAAAILLWAGWPQRAARGEPLFDPMCGSGTLLIEAAWIAADVAPGLLRRRWGFEAWRGHQPALWQHLYAQAQTRRREGRHRLPTIAGSDHYARTLAAARSSIERAGLSGAITLRQDDALTALPPAERPGLIVTNPPYGERLGAETELIKLYSLLGVHLKQRFGGWRVVLFTARADLALRLGLRADARHTLYNGAIACKLLGFNIRGADANAPAPSESGTAPASDASGRTGPGVHSSAPDPGGEDFANRLRKNLRHLGKWARRNGITNYRLYDADLPDYALAIDLYATPELHAHVQEYAAPKTIEPARAQARLREALAQIQHVLDIPPAQIHYKLRRPQKADGQYTRQAATGIFHEVTEHGCRLSVNFDDYLDTGLFLDHRPMRLRLQQEAAGKRVLNLFCYTGAATVHAACGGAQQTLSLDLSNTYLEWARRNLERNGVRATLYPYPPAPGERLAPHALIRCDCRQWLADMAQHPARSRFDLIFLDPPTFSTSKKMTGTLDIQRDHATLIRQCLALLAAGGTLYFSTNRRGFKLDAALQTIAEIDDITAQTLDADFQRPPPAHRCWRLRHRS